MAKSNDFVPEEIDGQNQPIIQSLRQVYRISPEDAQSLAGIEERLVATTSRSLQRPHAMPELAIATQPRTTEQQINPRPPPGGNARGYKPPRRFRSYAMGLVAIIVVTILISGFVFLFASFHNTRGVATSEVATPGVVRQSIVVVGSYSGTISALRSSDGSLLWQYQAGHPLSGPSMTIQGDAIYAASLDGHVYAIRIDSGKLLWQQKETLGPNPYFRVSPGNVRIAADSDVVAVSYTRLLTKNGRASIIYVYRAQSGTLLWHYQPQTYSPLIPLLGVGSKAVYVTEVQSSGSSTLITKALREGDGTEIWRNSIHAITWPGWDGAPSLVVGNGVLYGYGTGLLALNAQSGTLLWEQKAAQDGYTGEIVAGGGEVYLATEHRFCAYQMSNGNQLWCTYTRQNGNYAEGFEQTVYMNDTAYVGRGGFNPQGFRIEAWDAGKGILRWSWPASSSLLSPDFSWRFTGSNGVLYVPSQQGLYAVRGSDGHQLWFARMTIGFSPIVAGP